VSKAIGVPLAKLAAKIMAGKTLTELGFTQEIVRSHYAVKEAIFPFLKFPGTDTLLGPEMLSTGEVMGISNDFGNAYAKAQIAVGNSPPSKGTVLFSVKDSDKAKTVTLAKKLHEMGFKIVATKGTYNEIVKDNIPAQCVFKITEGRPHIVDAIINGDYDLIINTTVGKQSIIDSFSIRRNALEKQIPYVTTIRGGAAVVQAIESIRKKKIGVKAIQLYYK
jgi:carbamoyl-phosphate synthase large subunit